jgi:hypothetical protein
MGQSSVKRWRSSAAQETSPLKDLPILYRILKNLALHNILSILNQLYVHAAVQRLRLEAFGRKIRKKYKTRFHTRLNYSL